MIGTFLRLGFLGVLVALLGWNTAQWWTTKSATVDSLVVEVPASTPALTAGDVSLARAPLASFSDTVNRPLFFEGRTYPERRPVVAPAPPPSVAAAPPPMISPKAQALAPPPPVTTDGLKLLGILVNKGQARALIEVSPQSGEWLGVGAKVRDWTIDSISADRVALKLGRQSATLELYGLSPTNPGPRVR